MSQLQAPVPVLLSVPSMLQGTKVPARTQRRRTGGGADAADERLPLAAGVPQHAVDLHPAPLRLAAAVQPILPRRQDQFRPKDPVGHRTGSAPIRLVLRGHHLPGRA